MVSKETAYRERFGVLGLLGEYEFDDRAEIPLRCAILRYGQANDF